MYIVKIKQNLPLPPLKVLEWTDNRQINRRRRHANLLNMYRGKSQECDYSPTREI
jgi:hypothetical protein